MVFHTVSPISPNTLAIFIAYMYDKQYASLTLSSYVSALGHTHKFLSFPDPTKALLYRLLKDMVHFVLILIATGLLPFQFFKD